MLGHLKNDYSGMYKYSTEDTADELQTIHHSENERATVLTKEYNKCSDSIEATNYSLKDVVDLYLKKIEAGKAKTNVCRINIVRALKGHITNAGTASASNTEQIAVKAVMAGDFERFKEYLTTVKKEAIYTQAIMHEYLETVKIQNNDSALSGEIYSSSDEEYGRRFTMHGQVPFFLQPTEPKALKKYIENIDKWADEFAVDDSKENLLRQAEIYQKLLDVASEALKNDPFENFTTKSKMLWLFYSEALWKMSTIKHLIALKGFFKPLNSQLVESKGHYEQYRKQFLVSINDYIFAIESEYCRVADEQLRSDKALYKYYTPSDLLG